MLEKIVISQLTWRSVQAQLAALHDPSVPVFTVPDELSSLFRPTTRKVPEIIHVMSIAVVAAKEAEAVEFARQLNNCKAALISLEEDKTWKTPINIAKFIKAWKHARRKGVAKRGGDIAAARKKLKTQQAAEIIRDRWPLPSKEWPTRALLAEAGMSLNAIKSVLGKRPIAQYNYQGKMKRKAYAKR